MATLERLRISFSPELDGAMMKKILKLPSCYRADIHGCKKLLENWKHLKGETEHLIVVLGGKHKGGRDRDREERGRPIRVALLHGKCVEVNNATDQLMERSSLLVGLEEGATATVALIMLPIQLQSHQHQTLQRFVEMARETAETNGSGKFQIVCARKVELDAERPTSTEEEERAEEEGIRQILKSLPKGSCAIPSSESKRVKILTDSVDWYTDKLGFFIANVGVDIEGPKFFQNVKFIKEDEISENVPSLSETRKAEHKHYNSIHDFIISIRYLRRAEGQSQSQSQSQYQESKKKEFIEAFKGNFMEAIPHLMRAEEQCQSQSVAGEREKREVTEALKDNFIKSIRHIMKADEQSQSESVAGESKTREFIEALKGNGINYLFTNNCTSKVLVDDLHGKAIGFIICHFNFFEWIKLQQIYKDLQQKDSNFIWIWIPSVLSKHCGHGSYTRLIQCMPWAAFPHTQLVNVEYRDPFQRRDPCFVLLDKDGQIANRDALPLLMGWGVKSYPFTEHTIPESFFLVESQSCLEFLLHGMNIVGRKPMKNKMTFLYTDHPRKCLQKNLKLEELTQIHGSFEVLYVGHLHASDKQDMFGTENLKQEYEDATQYMRWPSLSFSDMIMFWYRCEYLASKKMYELKESKLSNIMMKTLHGLVDQLYLNSALLVLVDNGGLVTGYGEEVVQMICKSSDEICDGEGMAMRMVKNEFMRSLSGGERTPLVSTFFRDEIRNFPQHPQHRIKHSIRPGGFTCDVCGGCFIRGLDDGSIKRSYECLKCNWNMCWTCWMAYATAS